MLKQARRASWTCYFIHVKNVSFLLKNFQDGRIDYNEFVAMMQKGHPVNGGGGGKKGLEHSFSTGFRDALRL